METMTLHQILQAVNGSLLGDFNDLSVEISEVETDSRKAQKNTVFFALIGRRFDAHDFIDGMLDSDITGFIISKEQTSYHPDKFYIKVADTHKALGDLAKWYRSLFKIPFIAVTGSVGKTTTKDMIASVLSEKYSVLKTDGNFNNTIGLPLTIFRLKKSHEICVLEMGMDQLGEIDYMGNIVNPDVAVITNIGDSHMERLGSREGIRKAKFEILPHIKADGLFLFNDDDPMLSISYDNFSFSTEKIAVNKDKGTYIVGKSFIQDMTSTIFPLTHPKTQETISVSVPSLGRHMAYAILFSMAVAEHFNLNISQCLQGISAYKPSKMRMNLEKYPQSILMIDDTYNASPQSMKAALEILSQYEKETKVAILGDMLELGEISQASHREIGVYAEKCGIDHLICLGPQSKWMEEAAKSAGMANVYHFEDKNDALPFLETLIQPHTTFLWKASRGMALDKLFLALSTCVKEKNLTE